MIFPLFASGAFSATSGLIAAVIIGIAFGFVLERAGLGSATKLAGQFYGTDFVVFRVMFAAIVTAMSGVLTLSWLGLMDVERLAVPHTWLLPQLVGGLLFGAGFVMGGLCPGTSCVAAATGRTDGIALILGMLAGTALFGEVFPLIGRFYDSTSLGRFTLPVLLHLPEPLVVVLIALMSVGCFAGLGAWERRRRATA